MLQSKLQLQEQDSRATKLQLLLANPEDDALIKLARAISPNNQFTRDEDALGIKVTKDKYTEEFNVTFSKAELHAEACKYNLAFIPGKSYQGEYTPEFLRKLKDFLESTSIHTMDASDLQNQIWILSPGRGDKPIQGMTRYPCKDPLLFYRVEPDYFVLIDGAKNYINLYQWWLGLKNYSENSCRLMQWLENIVIMCAIFYGIFFFSHLTLWWLFGIIPVSFVLMLIRMRCRKSYNEDLDHCSSYFNENKYK